MRDILLKHVKRYPDRQTEYSTCYHRVFEEIDCVLKNSGEKQVLVAIDGMCGSGKSTLGRILEEIYDCNLFHMDDFFLRPEQRTAERLAAAGGNVDYERFQEEILDHVGDPQGFSYQIYSCKKQAMDDVVQVPYKKLNIIEGAYSEHPYFGDIYDLRFVCKITPEEQENRILKRNGAEMLKRFQNVWIPMENKYFETFEIEEKSIVIDTNARENAN